MRLQHYIWLLQRRFWLILLGVILCTSATAAISFKKAPVYEASATIEVNSPDSDVYGDQTLAVAYALQITNTNIFNEVARKLPGVTLIQLQNAVTASPIDGTQLIDISADSASPQQAVAIANTVAQVFIDQRLASDTARQQTILNQLSAQLTVAQAQMNQAQAHVNLLEQENAPASQIQQANNTLVNDQSIYESLMTSYNTVQTQKAMITGSLSIDQLATLPVQPLGTSKALAIALAAVMSLILMLLVVFLLDWIDVTIKTAEDVGHLARLNALGSIPLQPEGSNLLPELPGEEDNDALEQVFAVIGTNLQALYKGQRALLVTGLRHEAGTSTTAVRLALTLAQSGLRILLVDANLRKPSLHNAFQVVNTRGLLNSLTDAMTIQEQPAQIHNWLSKWTTQVPNLWLWPGGSASISPLTALRSVELRKMVNWLLQEPATTPDSTQASGPAIDLIIFDAPALLEGADATALALLCDSTVLVINAARERKETLKEAGSTLERLGAPILGVVVNRQKTTHHPSLYIGQSEQEASLAEPLATKTPRKYPLLASSAFQPASLAAPIVATPLPSVTYSLDEEVTTIPFHNEGMRSNIPRRPFRPTLSHPDFAQPEEQGKQLR